MAIETVPPGVLPHETPRAASEEECGWQVWDHADDNKGFAEQPGVNVRCVTQAEAAAL